jgi:RNA polymerase sigma-70 factor (ECF subfamily)
MLSKDPKCLDRIEAGSTYPQNGGLPRVVADAEPDAGARDSSTALKWETLVQRIQARDPRAAEELYEIMNRGVRFSLVRRLPIDQVDDRIHDIFVIVLLAIQNNQLREPARLMGFIWTVAHRQVASYIDDAVKARQTLVPRWGHLECPAVADLHDSGSEVMLREQSELITAALMALSEKEQEILRRFYIEHQPKEVICEEMRLTLVQFRLRKSRAKTKFGKAGRKALHPLRIRLGMAIAQSASTTGGQREQFALARAVGMR